MSDAIIMHLRYTPVKHFQRQCWCCMVSIIQVNRTRRSVNMIQLKKLAFRRQTLLNHCYIYIYIYVSGIYAAVDMT